MDQCRTKIRPRPASFELLGFDIMIRNDLSPVLLEVNLSPACAGRTTYLQRNLEKMTGGLLAILTHKLRRSGNLLGKWLRKQVQEKTMLEKAIEEKSILEQQILEKQNLETSKEEKEESEVLKTEFEKETVEEIKNKTNRAKVEENNVEINKKTDFKNTKKASIEQPESDAIEGLKELVKTEEKEKRQIWKEEFRKNLKTLEAHSLRAALNSESQHPGANIGRRNRNLKKPLMRKFPPDIIRETVYAFKSDPSLPSDAFFLKQNEDQNCKKISHNPDVRNTNPTATLNDPNPAKERENDAKTFKIVDPSEIERPCISGWKLVTYETHPEEIQRIIVGKMDLAVFGTKIDIRREIKREEKIRKDYFARVLQRFFREISERKWLSRMQENG